MFILQVESSTCNVDFDRSLDYVATCNQASPSPGLVIDVSYRRKTPGLLQYSSRSGSIAIVIRYTKLLALHVTRWRLTLVCLVPVPTCDMWVWLRVLTLFADSA